MFKKIRVAILLSILLFVALGEFLAQRRSTDWHDTLWVDVYLVNGDHLDSTQRYVDSIDAKEFAGVAEFFAAEAKRYGIKIEQPFRLNVVGEYHGDVPTPGAHPSLLGTMWWSLEMRWLALELDWQSSGPRPDIVAFAIYHQPDDSAVLDSTGLRKGLIAVTNLFASRDERGSNQVVLAHELLHTLGATDKYSLASNLPQFPDGFADPTLKPLVPQKKAELMAGRIPLDAEHAEMPESLHSVVVGRLTAQEIGWLHE
jgi:hypothetical protein